MAIWGAISLQGPHHVANQSTTTTGFAAMVSLKPAALEGTRQHTVSIVEPASEVGAAAAGRRRACGARGGSLLLLAWGTAAGQGEDNSRLNVVDSHLGQCGVE